MATAVETVKTFMNVLTKYSQDSTQIGEIALNDAIRTVTTYSSLDEAKKDLVDRFKDTETYPDTDTRLKEATGMVLGTNNDFSVDTGAISGSNAGGDTVKDAQSIVPEDGDLSTAELPTPGTTTPITYTGDDGKSFTFYAKWPDSFTTIVHGFNISGVDDLEAFDNGFIDSRNYVDLAQFDSDTQFSYVKTYDDGSTETVTYSSYGDIINGISTVLKGLNTYWLKGAAKLDYDSLGMGLDGQTIEIKFMGGSWYDLPLANTFAIRKDYLPADELVMALKIVKYADELDPVNQNGAYIWLEEPDGRYLDRVFAHEMVHAIMYSNGTIKKGMPEFFTEGIAEVVQGDDDYNSESVDTIQSFVADPSILEAALGLGEGTGTPDAYPAGDMFMRFIAKQSLDLTSIVGDSTQAQTFSYDTKSAVITNYTESDKINFNQNVGGYSISKTFDDFQVEGTEQNKLIIRDARGKFMTFETPNGTAYAYMAANSTEVDGKNFGDGNNYEVIFGSNYENDIIRAGNGGSYLWGGLQGNDELFGGNGVDTFAYAYYGGNDTIQNAESQDNIRLNSITLDMISSAQINDNGVNLQFTDGGSLNISGQAGTFLLENEDTVTSYTADYQNKTWSQQG